MRTAVSILPPLLAALLLALAGGWAGADGQATAPPPVLPPGQGLTTPATTLQWSIDPDAALAKAKATGRPVYIYVWAKYNPACMYMADTVLADDAVMAQLQNFELVALDGDNRANFPFFDRYKIRYVRVLGPTNEPVPYEAGLQVTGGARFPTNLFLDSQGQEVYRDAGVAATPDPLTGQPSPNGARVFATRLLQVQEVVKAWDNVRHNPTSAAAEVQLGHLYAQLEVLPEAKKHLQKALDMDPQNQTGLRADINLDLLIMGIPADPAGSLNALQAWQKQYPTHPRQLEAVFYEAVAEVARARALVDTGADASARRANNRLVVAGYDAALALLDPFYKAKKDSPLRQSEWYKPALGLIADIQAARAALLAAPPG
jgi:tetratricopeptide (TPR) repeat protein